jgi:2'-5' RNA ligase
MRLFVGVPLPDEVTEQLLQATHRLRPLHNEFRWSAPESWHITLQFLGSASQEQYDCVVERLRDLSLPPVPVELEDLGFFERSGIVFAGVKVSLQLQRLQQKVSSATSACGFISETRTYQPHITLARAKGRSRSKGWPALNAAAVRQPGCTGFVASEFLLYESFLDPSGSRYAVRERFQLVFDQG